MLSPYKYIKHDLEKVQKFIDYIFYRVWFKASPNQSFSAELFTNEEFKKLFLDLYVSGEKRTDAKEKAAGAKFCTLVEDIFYIVTKLPKKKKDEFYRYYKINSNIKSLCENVFINPITYKDLEKLDEKLSKKVKDFNNLPYGSGSILKLDALLKISSFEEHYGKFVEKNGNTCLFCGLEKLETVKGYRSDYDHFLQKAKYPFVSINLKNLAPACDKCNRKFKLSNDPLHHKYEKKRNVFIYTRRKSIYPYSTNNYMFKIKIDFVNLSESKGVINPENINIKIHTKSIKETSTWDDLYNISSRYKNVCSVKDEALNWIKVAKKIMEKSKIDIDQYIELEKLRYEDTSKYHEINFLKIPFLEACKEAGII